MKAEPYLKHPWLFRKDRKMPQNILVLLLHTTLFFYLLILEVLQYTVDTFANMYVIQIFFFAWVKQADKITTKNKTTVALGFSCIYHKMRTEALRQFSEKFKVKKKNLLKSWGSVKTVLQCLRGCFVSPFSLL